MSIADRFEGCILAGAIGDAMGSGYEFNVLKAPDTYYIFDEPTREKPPWQLTDDTQLSIATVEAWIKGGSFDAEGVAQELARVYATGRLRGAGASTVKALQELCAGGHWSQVGRRGEFAAGNGAAMRIAPLAFDRTVSNKQIREVSYITHQNQEAYVGARCVVGAIHQVIYCDTDNVEQIINSIATGIPDTNVRDRLHEVAGRGTLESVGKLCASAYVVDSVPLAIFAGVAVGRTDLQAMYERLIQIGGDTDTNCSIAGQIAGAAIGAKAIPTKFKKALAELDQYRKIKTVIEQFTDKQQWT